MSPVASHTFARAFFLGVLFLTFAGIAHAATVERLSLFVYDGTNVYEDRRVVSPQSNLPTGVTPLFTANTNAQGEHTWEWVLQNTSGAALNNLRVTVLLDADITPEDNTFHNEHGKLLQLSAPVDHIAADKWEIGELGYLHGDLLSRATIGNLLNQADQQGTSTADDTAMALSFDIGILDNDDMLTVTATLADTGNEGLLQTDAHNSTEQVFQAYAKLGPITPKAIQTVDYAVTKTTTTPSINVGDTASYTITITNEGAENGTGVTLTDTVPAGINVTSWTCAGNGAATCNTASGSGNNISLTGNVPSGAANYLTITVTGTAISTGTITNIANIAPTNSGDTIDSNTANNTDSASITVAATGTSADLSIDKTTTTPTVNAGDPVNYQLTITNNGTDDVTGATITDNVPNQITSVIWACTTTTGGANCAPTNDTGNAISLTADIPANGTITIDISGEASGAGTIANTASVSSTVNDPDPTNNQSTVTITVASLEAQPIPTHTSIALIVLMLLLAGGVAVRLRKTRKLPMLCLIVLVFGLTLNTDDAQAIFQNGYFETGDFSNWEMGYGLNYGLGGSHPFTANDVIITSGGKEILEVVGHIFDPRAPQLTLPRQGNFTAKVNDETNNYHLNYISQKDTLTEADRDPTDGKLHVRFTYAAVLEDPNHEPNGQPYFYVQLKDLTTDEVLYYDFAYSNQPGRVFFTTYYSGTWRSTPFIDVDMEVPDSSLNHELEVRVLAADCAHSGHGGYVYVDAFGAHAVPPQSGCINGLVARGKPGMVQLVWPDNGAAKYRVYRAPALAGPYEALGETDSRHSTWLDRTPETSKVYYYSIRPLDSSGAEICTSGEVIGIAPPTWSPGDALDRPPYFTSIPVESGDIQTPYTYKAAVVDADGDSLTYSLIYGPTGMTVEPSTGEIDWQPTEIGFYRVNIAVEDGNSNIVNQAFTIEVTDSNQAPVINNPLPVRVRAYASLSHDLQATDPEGDSVVYSIGSQASGLTVSSSGIVTWSSPLPGSYPVTIVVADIHGAKTQQAMVLEVLYTQAFPQFVSYPVIRGTVNALYRYQAQAEDADSPVLEYSLINAPSGMTIDKDSGLIQWMPDTIGANFAVAVQAIDPDGNAGIQTFTIRVTDEPNHAPYFTATPVVYIAYPNTYNYTASATDSDGDTKIWSLLQAPVGMTIVETTGRITWKPDSATEGVFTVEVQVIDQRGGVATQLFDVRVPSSTNRSPQIYSTPTLRVTAGQTYTYYVSVSDPDGETVTLTLNKSPAAMTVTDNRIQWITTAADIGIHEIELEASDPRGGYAIQTWSLEVVPAASNYAPFFNSAPIITGTAGKTYTYQVSAYDWNSDPITYSLETAPIGMIISASGRIEWAIPEGTVGSFTVEIKVSDDKGAYALQTYSIGVGGSGNRPPRITNQPTSTATAGRTYVYQISATDPDGDSLTYELNQSPSEMTISATGRVEWAVPTGTSGQFDIEIEVSDGRGGYAYQSYTIGVGEEGNRPPRITSTPTVTGTMGGTYTYQITASDPDSDSLAYALLVFPVGMMISADGKIEWMIPADLVGEIDVEIEVSDGKGGVVRQGYTISVAGVGNRPPRFYSMPATIATTSIGVLYINQSIAATDPDGDTVTYTLITKPDGMTIDAATSKIEWTPGASQHGYHSIEVAASDGKGGVAVLAFTLYAYLPNNYPPRITSQPTYPTGPRVSYEYKVVATDPENEILTYSLVSAPAGMTISTDGVVSWDNPTIGKHNVTIIVSDPHGAYASQSFVLSVGENGVPQIVSPPLTTAITNQLYRYEVKAVDPDGDFLTYWLSNRPTGMTISASGVIEWTPTTTGYSYVAIRVSDGQDTDEQSFRLVVIDSALLNNSPVITSVPALTGTPGVQYTYQIIASDPDGDNLTYTIQEGPADAAVDTNGLLTWASPTQGSHQITLGVSDGVEETTQTFTLAISDSATNISPIITSVPPFIGTVGVGYTYQIIASDPDGDNLTYTIQEGPADATVDTNGLFIWASPTQGSHQITLMVSDGIAGTIQSFTLVISASIPVNTPPAITSIPMTTGVTGVEYTYQIEANDSDGDPLTYAIQEGPSDATVDTNGLFTWAIPTQGSYKITLRVSDGAAETTQTFTLVISDPTPGNNPPIITSTPLLNGTVGIKYTYQIEANDSDSDPLTYSLDESPQGMIISASGLIEWTPTATQAGNHNITAVVSDGNGGTTDQQYVLTVSATPPANNPPVITSTPIEAGITGIEYTYQIEASDPDNDPLTYAVQEGPIDTDVDTDGLFTWAAPTQGSHEITLAVSDGTAETTQTFTLVISDPTPVNNPPVITSTPIEAGTTGIEYTYQIEANDPDGDPLTYTVQEGPIDAAVDNNGLFTWATPTQGSHEIALAVSDGTAEVSQTFTLVISDPTPVNNPPVITSTPIEAGATGQAYTYQIEASDPDGDSLTYTLNTFPEGMTVSASGLIEWTPTATQVGNHNITVIVSDGNGGTVDQQYVLTVSAAPPANNPPQITSTPPTSAMVGVLYRYEIEANDPDGDSLTYTLTTAPNGMTVSATGIVEWTPAGAGTENIVIRVSDGQDHDEQSYTINVSSFSVQAQLISPQAGATYGEGTSLYLIATTNLPESDIQDVQFFIEGSQVGSGTRVDDEYLIRWTGIQEGEYELFARVYATDGKTYDTETVNIKALPCAPEIIITSPEDGTKAQAPASFTITADAKMITNCTGTVEKVEIYHGTTLLGTLTSSPYTLEWQDVAVGYYWLTAKATDSGGKETTSNGITVIVEEEGESGPKLYITEPFNGASVQGEMTQVTGTYEYDGDGFSIIVNGKRARVDTATKKFTVEDVYLSPGENSITAVLNSIESDDPAETSVTVTRTDSGEGSDIVSFSLSPESGYAPQDVTLSFLMGYGHSFYDYCSTIAYEKDGTAINPSTIEQLDQRTLAAKEGRHVFTLSETGNHKFTYSLFKKEDGVCAMEKAVYEGSRTVVIGTPESMANEVYSTYKAMLKQLKEGNAEKALLFFTGEAQPLYEEMFESLKDDLPAIADQISEVINGAVNDDVAELTIIVESQNGKSIFTVHLLQGGDGIWRIDGM
ncbi:MAG: hypothetical protein BACD_02595 [Bacteroides rodentium]